MVLEGAGHRVIDVCGCSQAQSLVSNGLFPDLLLIESLPAASSDVPQFHQLLSSVPVESTCLVTGIAEQGVREQASALGIRHFLMKPLTRDDLESMIEEISCPVVPAFCDAIASLPATPATRESDIPADMPAPPYVE